MDPRAWMFRDEGALAPALELLRGRRIYFRSELGVPPLATEERQMQPRRALPFGLQGRR